MKVHYSIYLATILVFLVLLAMESADANTPAPVDGPVIEQIEPAEPREWSAVIVTGEGLQAADGSCPLSFSGTRAYVFSCSPNEVRAIVPWMSGSADVVAGDVFSFEWRPAVASRIQGDADCDGDVDMDDAVW